MTGSVRLYTISYHISYIGRQRMTLTRISLGFVASQG